jgi:tetratricopeptide (TPR) repeat protein
MSKAGPSEQLPEAIVLNSPWEEAATLLEQAGKVGKGTPELNYLLAMCCKRDGKRTEARAALRKIVPPDANVMLQLGLLSFAEKQYTEAAEEFARAVELDPESFAANYDLLLCRLNLGQLDLCLELMPRLVRLAPDPGEQRFLYLLDQLIRAHHVPAKEMPLPSLPPGQNGEQATLPTLSDLSDDEEERLLGALAGVEQVEAVYPLIQTLAAWRPNSLAVQRGCLEMALVRGKQYADRYQWVEVEQLLSPLARLVETFPVGRDPDLERIRTALINFQGVAACMLQDFDRGIRAFTAALKTTSNKAWLHQNLALAYEWKGRLDQAESHWNRYFDLLDYRAPVAPIPNYFESRTFAGLCRLAELFSKHERLGSAISFLQRAHRIRPRDIETLDKLFQFYQQSRRTEDARRVLRLLREIRPNDPQFELYDLDLIDIRSLDDVDRILNEIRHIVSRHAGDARVEDRAVHAVMNLVPLIGRKSDQLADQLAQIVEQVRRLPNYQINWPVVHDEMRHLRVEFQKLRKLCSKCQALVQHDEQRRTLRDIAAQIDGRIEACVSMGG